MEGEEKDDVQEEEEHLLHGFQETWGVGYVWQRETGVFPPTVPLKKSDKLVEKKTKGKGKLPVSNCSEEEEETKEEELRTITVKKERNGFS